MGKVFHINGGVFATTGNLYTRNIYTGDGLCPEEAETITPPDGVLVIKTNTGSIFDTYHVTGFVTASGIKVGNIFAFKDIYSFTIKAYQQNRETLKSLLDYVPKISHQKNLFLQQQFSHVFSLLERFLCDTFVRQTCDKENSYLRVLDSRILVEKRIIRDKSEVRIITGEECLERQLLYIKAVKNIVYHRFDLISNLFSIAFGIQLNLDELAEALIIRNDIIHRFGYSDYGIERIITIDDVLSLMDRIDEIANTIISQITSLNIRGE